MSQAGLSRLGRALTVAVLVLAGCRTGNVTENSDVKYGFLTANPNRLVNVPNGGEIRFCGAYIEDMQWAISVWGAALGRSYTFVESCDNAQIKSYGPSDPFAKTECESWKQRGLDLTNRMYTQSHQSPMIMVDCNFYGNRREAVLHEVGHLFGLCDQYHSQLNQCEVTTTPVDGSVMRSAKRLDLSEDDITGIRLLASGGPRQGMITGAQTQLPGADLALENGTYRRVDTGKPWVITTVVIEGRMKALSIDDNGQNWTFLCEEATACKYSDVTVTPESPTKFTFTNSAGSYVFQK